MKVTQKNMLCEVLLSSARCPDVDERRRDTQSDWRPGLANLSGFNFTTLYIIIDVGRNLFTLIKLHRMCLAKQTCFFVYSDSVQMLSLGILFLVSTQGLPIFAQDVSFWWNLTPPWEITFTEAVQVVESGTKRCEFVVIMQFDCCAF